MSWFNYIPLVGTVKGAAQCLLGDKEEGIQAMKDSVKIPAIATFVTFSAIGGAAMNGDDDGTNYEDRYDAACGTGDTAAKIWNWGKNDEEKQKEKEEKQEHKAKM